MTNQEIQLSNRTIVDLHKVAYARFLWRSAEYERDCRPKLPTVRGEIVLQKEIALSHSSYPGESMIERARRLDLFDKWIPVCVAILNNGHRLEKTGKKAISFYEAYCAHIFGK